MIVPSKIVKFDESEPSSTKTPKMTKNLSEAGVHYKQLMKILKKNSNYPDPTIVSHKQLCREWIVIESEYDEDAGLKCLCGKENIHYINKIMNQYNGVVLDPIGSSCVKRFEIEQIGLACMCCSKVIGEDNVFLQAYMKFQSIKKDTLIIGHKQCAKKLFKHAKASGRYGDYLKKEFISYFKQLHVKVKLDRVGNIDIEYENEKLTTYMDMICECV